MSDDKKAWRSNTRFLSEPHRPANNLCDASDCRNRHDLEVTERRRMGATHFLMKRLPNVATEMALNVLQPHARHEHHRHQAAPGGNPSVKSSCFYAHRVTVQVAQRGPSLHPG